jgi:Glycerophosphoryl diester phosphodiesterase
MIERNKYKANDTTPFDESKLQDLQTIKHTLLHAKYGKDVRPGIAQLPDALIKTLQDSTDLGQLGALAELVEARGGFETLGLHETAQDNGIQNAKASAVNASQKGDNAINLARAAASGSPKGVFSNVDELKNKYPNGASGIYVTRNNGHWWFYNLSWQDGGVYQSPSIDNDSITPLMLTEQAKQVILLPGITPATYSTATKTITFGKGFIFRYFHHKLTKIPDGIALTLDSKGYSNGYIYVDLDTGIPGYEPYLYNTMPNNSAILACVSWASQPYIDGLTVAPIFSGALADYLIVDGKYNAADRNYTSNIEVTIPKAGKLIFDYDKRTLTFSKDTKIKYGNSIHSLVSEIVATPSEKVSSGITFQNLKVLYNLKNDTAKISSWTEEEENYITLGFLNTNIGLDEPYSKVVSSLPIEVINKPEDDTFNSVNKRKETTFNILHYGDHSVPAESAASYFKTIEKGWDLDGDIVFTKDNIPIMSHANSTTSGLLENIRNADGTDVTDVFDINNKTYEELCEYDWGIYRGEEWKGMNPLKLETLLKIIRANDCHAFLELKTTINSDQAKILRDLLNKYQVIDRITFESFSDRIENPRTIAEFIPKVNISIITMESLFHYDDFVQQLKEAKTKDNEVSAMMATTQDPKDVKSIADLGYPVDLWVVNDEETVAKFSELPIRGWATDGFDAKAAYQKCLIDSYLESN